MIQKELYIERKDGVKLWRTYSDSGVKIRKIGTDEIYEEAIDVIDYSYEETNILIEESEELNNDIL